MKVLLVEDDRLLARFLAKGLRQEGYVVEQCFGGSEGLALAREEGFDILIVDVMLPGIDGLSLIHRLRSEKITIPVLVLSAKGSVDDRVQGLTAGETTTWSSRSLSRNWWLGFNLCFEERK